MKLISWVAGMRYLNAVVAMNGVTCKICVTRERCMRETKLRGIKSTRALDTRGAMISDSPTIQGTTIDNRLVLHAIEEVVRRGSIELYGAVMYLLKGIQVPI